MNKVKEAFPEFEKPSVAVDTVILRVKNTDKIDAKTVSRKQLQVLLVKRHGEKDWHLPGTILRLGETPKDAIKRISLNKVNTSEATFEQLYTVADDPFRDDRGHIISIVYIGMLNNTVDEKNLNIKTTEYESQWFWVGKENTKGNNERKYVSEQDGSIITYMVYDHHKIINDTINRLKGKLMYTDIGFNFIEELFTIRELENTFNAINERDIPGFRRYISEKIEGTGELSSGNKFRPAELFRKRRYT
ncbi:MAG: NUDIX hydrolase [Lachnospiraceae bacterium]|nr:NUDIX hydrolase [Lachnospiraceae bacterium]